MTLAFWKNAITHTGLEELRAKRGRMAKTPKNARNRSLRVDKDVLDRFRESGPGWQTRMNAALRAYRDAKD
ncbi:MAG: BrnA antitoxin family protein [Lysobacterales bacterium]